MLEVYSEALNVIAQGTRETASTAAYFLPVVGQAKACLELSTGYDPVAMEWLSWEQRAVTVVGFVPWWRVCRLFRPGERLVHLGARETLVCASAAGEESAAMQIVRVIERGEKLDDLLNELKSLTFQTGKEHAIVSLRDGRRVIVRGGSLQIDMPADEVRRVIVHTHPYHIPALGPSDDDIMALYRLGKNPAAGQHQRHAYLLERGVLYRYDCK